MRKYQFLQPNSTHPLMLLVSTYLILILAFLATPLPHKLFPKAPHPHAPFPPPPCPAHIITLHPRPSPPSTRRPPIYKRLRGG
ncbi:hypothetical protein E2C01_062592 [Portunus trituberculatus]|uniref:Uncharacterized protein n=1 Tax=Portunus trituberculatus TaxID=210409 RepID=A0A5B7HBJ3_PORTR|nr:hypothetical protein [Portunus trituberculatus]